MLEGGYDDGYLETAGKDAPKFTDIDMKIIGSPVDFVGISAMYTLLMVKASEQAAGYQEVPFSVSQEDVLRLAQAPARVAVLVAAAAARDLKPKEIYITENGCAAQDTIAADGHVYDSDRVTYLRDGMMWQHSAIARRRADQRQLLLERDGQLRVDQWLRRPIRPRIRRLQDLETYS